MEDDPEDAAPECCCTAVEAGREETRVPRTGVEGSGRPGIGFACDPLRASVALYSGEACRTLLMASPSGVLGSLDPPTHVTSGRTRVLEGSHVAFNPLCPVLNRHSNVLGFGREPCV